MKQSKELHAARNHGWKRINSALVLAIGAGMLASPANASITFTQTVDDWWLNTFTWDAQVERIVCLPNADPVGTTKSVWGRVVQENGSEVGTAIFCTTMTKATDGAFTDRWDVSVPAGMITDKDFWDASSLCFELTDCSSGTKKSYLTAFSPYGELRMEDYAGGDLSPDPETRYVSINPGDWDDQGVRDDGFHFAVYAYGTEFGLPMILNHVDELGLSTFNYNELDAFGTGQPYNPHQLEILGITLDDNWDLVAQKSFGLQTFDWQLFPGGGGVLFTDQGQFQILQVQPLTKGWFELCPADFTGEGVLDIFDILAFLDAFNAGDPAADFTGDGNFDIFDILAFLDAFNAGCP